MKAINADFDIDKIWVSIRTKVQNFVAECQVDRYVSKECSRFTRRKTVQQALTQQKLAKKYQVPSDLLNSLVQKGTK